MEAADGAPWNRRLLTAVLSLFATCGAAAHHGVILAHGVRFDLERPFGGVLHAHQGSTVKNLTLGLTPPAP